MAADVESFFARMMIPIDFEPGAEAIVSAATPLGRYAAMVADFAARVASPSSDEAWLLADPEAQSWARWERARAQRPRAGGWAEGCALLERIKLSRPDSGRPSAQA